MTAKQNANRFVRALLAVGALMMIGAAGSHANWMVEGKELTTNTEVTIKAATPVVYTVEKLNLEIKCTTVKASEFKLLAKSATAEGKISLSGCSSFSPIGSETESKNCKPKEPFVFGTKRLIVLHNGKNYLLDEPSAANGVLGVIEFSELCSLTERAEIKGKLALECVHFLSPPPAYVFLDCDVSAATHWVRDAPLALFPSDLLSFNGSSMTQSGVLEEALVSGAPWGGQV
ncbi:MAG TPA: hypothetical protein VJQ84_03160 [Solirubrobacterales bacterium]|nr:hypothetical protein [Solirubrobacterales bacterium]